MLSVCRAAACVGQCQGETIGGQYSNRSGLQRARSSFVRVARAVGLDSVPWTLFACVIGRLRGPPHILRVYSARLWRIHVVMKEAITAHCNWLLPSLLPGIEVRKAMPCCPC